MNDIVELFRKYNANKFVNSTELVYRDILPCNVDALLEIGIGKGGSLNAWCELYPDAHIFGVEITKNYVDAYEGRAKTYLGDVSDKEFMLVIVRAIPSLDIVIDDGSHKAKNQQDAFEVLFPKLKLGGLYIIEDLHVATDVAFASDGYLDTLRFLKEMPHKVEFHYEHTAVIRRGMK